MTDFKYETELCAAFSETLPEAWTIYNETAGFDMVLVHSTGAQIGVEAKLKLNAKVLSQVCDFYGDIGRAGPDFRAVLVGGKPNVDLMNIARLLGVTVIFMGRDRETSSSYGVNRRPRQKVWSKPKLPDVEPMKDNRWAGRPYWNDLAPIERLKLPEYVPDVIAGDSAPVTLGHWKIKAIKVCVYLEKREFITRAEFKALRIDPSRWMNGIWLKKGEMRGQWVPGPSFPAATYKRLHPKVYDEIDFDFEKWAKEAGIL